ncbi:glycogen synthase GlgA [Marispirochaeta aestuarii]|uniref:glycogen synthase GlgA n=1 Tax=Marispirochaeta aestuarii TaxID=1963862 RepID=UPI0029C84908|nr:glycogen synthase GlgA [Marispirochaeta aestuarii]
MPSQNVLKILMVSSEAVPFAKSGGLADMVGSLAKHLAGLGHDVKLLIPAYKGVDYTREESINVSVNVGFRTENTVCGRIALAGSNVSVYLLEHPYFTERKGIYGNEEEEFFADNAKRFALLSRAAFSLLRAIDWKPDVIHSHDWPTALVPVYLRTLERNQGFEGTISLFTIHNIGYQGIFSLHDLHYTRLRLKDVCLEKGEHLEQLNFLRGGIRCADYVSTVSPQYAREIRTARFGHGLEAELEKRREDLFGILNGIDAEIWNPETDSYLPLNYSKTSLDKKLQVKTILQEEAGLSVDPGIPLIGIVSRLVEQKGFRELCGPGETALKEILDRGDCQIVILGTGEKWCEEVLRSLAAEYENLRVRIGFDEKLAHMIEGGSDFFLMPSRYEPCGLNQMYSLRYGTVPIVRKTGGLADTVICREEDPSRENGFLFEEITGEAIRSAVAEAVRIYREEPDRILRMRMNGMSEDFSWNQSAERYVELYRYGLRRGRHPDTEEPFDIQA